MRGGGGRHSEGANTIELTPRHRLRHWEPSCRAVSIGNRPSGLESWTAYLVPKWADDFIVDVGDRESIGQGTPWGHSGTLTGDSRSSNSNSSSSSKLPHERSCSDAVRPCANCEELGWLGETIGPLASYSWWEELCWSKWELETSWELSRFIRSSFRPCCAVVTMLLMVLFVPADHTRRISGCLWEQGV